MKAQLFSGFGVFACIALLNPISTDAQIRASERGGVSQTVDGTTITVEYGRPQARGREDVFGSVVTLDHMWTPGANWATTLELDKDATINGHSVPAGDFSVWFDLQGDDWTLVLDPEPMQFHLMPPAPSEQQVRFSITPEDASLTEVLTFAFTEVRPTGTVLEMKWGTRAVSLEIGVQPSRPIIVEAEVAAQVVGEYTFTTMGMFGDAQVPFEIAHENGILVARWPDSPNPGLRETWLIALGPGMFQPAELKDGELFDIVVDLIYEFDPLDGTATGFELRGPGDMLLGTAVRD